MVNWSTKDYEKKTGQKPPKHSKAVKLPKSTPVGLQHIKNSLKLNNIQYVTELKFSDERQFRFDIAIPYLKVAIEYEGMMSEKSGHTTILGYTKDCTKYNLAQLEGWKVLRYTTLNFSDFDNDLKKLLP